GPTHRAAGASPSREAHLEAEPVRGRPPVARDRRQSPTPTSQHLPLGRPREPEIHPAHLDADAALNLLLDSLGLPPQAQVEAPPHLGVDPIDRSLRLLADDRDRQLVLPPDPSLGFALAPLHRLHDLPDPKVQSLLQLAPNPLQLPLEGRLDHASDPRVELGRAGLSIVLPPPERQRKAEPARWNAEQLPLDGGQLPAAASEPPLLAPAALLQPALGLLAAPDLAPDATRFPARRDPPPLLHDGLLQRRERIAPLPPGDRLPLLDALRLEPHSIPVLH